jgi:small-conductance mechanosensitive channel
MAARFGWFRFARVPLAKSRGCGLRRHGFGLALLLIVFLLCLNPVRAADEPAPPSDSPADAMSEMSSGGWLERIIMQLETEAVSDVSMAPDTGMALVREWRSLSRDGSGWGALISVGWVALAAALAVAVERLAARAMSYRLRRRMRVRPGGPGLGQLLLLLMTDMVGVFVFTLIFRHLRYRLVDLGVAPLLIVLAGNVLIRWRIAALIVRVVLRPGEPVARLVPFADTEAHSLGWFMSGVLLAIVALVGFGRVGLADVDSGAPHVLGLVIAVLVCILDALIVFRARGVAQALIRGYPTSSVVAAIRAALARAWLPIGFAGVLGLFVVFVFGLSLGLLEYYHALTSTLGVVLVLLVFERLTERAWHEADPGNIRPRDADALMARSSHRILRAVISLVAALTLGWIWTEAIELTPTSAAQTMQSVTAAAVTLFIGYIAWELMRLAIDRHLQPIATGPKLPGVDDEEEEAAPASRLQTMLPMLRAALGTIIAVLAVLIVLSRLGVDTAPLIAGAGVFGLALSFGSQSLVRDIISGLFYMWDDAFRVGEYIDTGRLKGTVETLGIRSLKLRHHNGPLHTIPYGQLGAVTNQSRDYATIKFNLRLEKGTDVELVRKTAKQIGLAMQEEPEIAAEVILPLKLQGIAEVADNAVVMRFKFTARPVKPSWIQREYLKRMYKLFAEKGITFASGAVMLQTLPSRPSVEESAVAPPEPFGGVTQPLPSRVA